MGQVNLQPPPEHDDYYGWLDDLDEDVTGRMRVIHALKFCDKFEPALESILSIDLSKASPTPWRSHAYNVTLGDTGDYLGCCDVNDAADKVVLCGRSDGDSDLREVEIGDWTHDANCVVAAECVNMIAKLQEEFGNLKGGPDGEEET